VGQAAGCQSNRRLLGHWSTGKGSGRTGGTLRLYPSPAAPAAQLSLFELQKVFSRVRWQDGSRFLGEVPVSSVFERCVRSGTGRISETGEQPLLVSVQGKANS